MKNIIVAGALGRMGKEIVSELRKKDFLKVFGVDKDDDFPEVKPDLMIDFSTKEGVFEHLEYCKENNCAFLTGVTGFTSEEYDKIKSYGEFIPVLLDYNMSIGINVITSILAELKNKLSSYDIEITETHHKNKKDAPSGTAKKLYDELNKKDEFKEVNGRKGFSLRQENEIGIHAVRGGGVFGEHTVRFLGDFEEVGIYHRAFSRKTFVTGAINSGLWLMKQDNGFYTMRDFLKVFD